MQFSRKKPMKTVGFRLPDEIRKKALNHARNNGVTESDVYRSIVVNFFSPRRKQIVYVKMNRKVAPDKGTRVCGDSLSETVGGD